MSESENEEMVLPEEDILRLTRPAKRKSMMKKEKSYRKKGSHGSYESEEKINLVKKIIEIFQPLKSVNIYHTLSRFSNLVLPRKYLALTRSIVS